MHLFGLYETLFSATLPFFSVYTCAFYRLSVMFNCSVYRNFLILPPAMLVLLYSIWRRYINKFLWVFRVPIALQIIGWCRQSRHFTSLVYFVRIFFLLLWYEYNKSTTHISSAPPPPPVFVIILTFTTPHHHQRQKVHIQHPHHQIYLNCWMIGLL